MAFGKNKNLILKFIVGLTGCFFVFISYKLGYDWYVDNFTPRSRGVSLGFVAFYMRYIIIPSVFLSAFIKLRLSIVMIITVIIYMVASWYSTNPMRVILMLASYLSGYLFIIIVLTLRRKHIDNF